MLPDPEPIEAPPGAPVQITVNQPDLPSPPIELAPPPPSPGPSLAEIQAAAKAGTQEALSPVLERLGELPAMLDELGAVIEEADEDLRALEQEEESVPEPDDPEGAQSVQVEDTPPPPEEPAAPPPQPAPTPAPPRKWYHHLLLGHPR